MFEAGACTGLHVLHPNGAPTLAYLGFDSNSELRLWETIDGVTGANWVATAGVTVETNGASPSSFGQSIVFRDSIVWAHAQFTGGAGVGSISQYDLKTSVLTRYNPNVVGDACTRGLHVHNNKLFMWAHKNLSNDPGALYRLDGGVFTELYDSGTGSNLQTPATQHPALFTDYTSGDLIVVAVGQDIFGNQNNRMFNFPNAESGIPIPTDISATVMGAVDVGAGKYRQTGSAQSRFRRWAIFVDTITDPANPRTYLTTWIPGGSTETWEWKGLAAPMEAVALLAGISDEIALPYNTRGDGGRSPSIARISIGDTANPPVEVPGGTKMFFRGSGESPAGTLTFRGIDDQGAPSTIVPIAAGSLTIGEGLLYRAIAYFKMENDFLDSSGSGNDYQNNSAVTFSAGLFGQATDYDGGVNNYMEPVDGQMADARFGGFESYAISCWIDVASITGGHTIAANSNQSTKGFDFLVQASGAVQFFAYGTGVDQSLISSAGAITVGAGWQHVVVSSDGTTARLYVDGVEVDSAAAVELEPSTSRMLIGQDPFFGSAFNGLIDEFLMHRYRYLTPAEVGYLYNAGSGFEANAPTPFAVTPTISGNTVINLVPDRSNTLYSVVLDTTTAGIDEGETGLLIAELL